MSDETKRQLDQAIRDHINDENGDDGAVIVTDWVLSAANAEASPDYTGYWYFDSKIPIHHAIGLLRKAQIYIERDV